MFSPTHMRPDGTHVQFIAESDLTLGLGGLLLGGPIVTVRGEDGQCWSMSKTFFEEWVHHRDHPDGKVRRYAPIVGA